MLIGRYLENIREKTELSLKENLPLSKDRVSRAARYAVLNGGKRLRPILLVAALESLGGKINKEIFKIASAIEFIHAFSLIQDDLPSMDNDDYRRGKLTTHKVFGEDIAILASDILLSEACRIILDDNSLAQELKVKITFELMRVVRVLVRGQEKDLELTQKKRVGLSKLNEVYLDKTAALIAVCMKIAGILRRVKSEELMYLNSCGEKLGLAYQISDDILNVTSDKKMFKGKRFSDQRKGKITYVSLVGIEKSKSIAENLIKEAKRDMANIKNLNKERLYSLCDFIMGRTY